MLGLIQSLTDPDCPIGRVLRENFTFKIIPNLNPDGVARGYWRTDTQALNLNRFYDKPDPKLHPTIYATKLVILQQHAQYKRLHAYIDLHGHSTKKGCFVFGNTIDDESEQEKAMLFAKLLSLNSVNFDFKESSFKDEENNALDREGLSRNGSGRAIIYRDTGLPLCYTLECNYCTGVRMNSLNPRYEVETGNIIKQEEDPVQDIKASHYKNKKAPNFSAAMFVDIGKAIGKALLDYHLMSPVTRIITRKGMSYEAALGKISKEVTCDLAKLKSKKSGLGFVPDFALITEKEAAPRQDDEEEKPQF